MTRSVEIPDEAVEAGAKAIRPDLWADLHLQLATTHTENLESERAVVLAKSRAALVAARPYLMPTREEIAEAMHNHWSDTHTWRQGCSEDVCIAIFLDRADAVAALLSTSGDAK